MSKQTYKKKPRRKFKEREATISEVKRIPFSEIPQDLIDLSYTEEGNDKVFFVFSLLRWAKRSNKLFDADVVCFITIAELSESQRKGNFCLLKESEYPAAHKNKDGTLKTLAKGVKIIMEDSEYGWQPKRVLQQEDF